MPNLMETFSQYGLVGLLSGVMAVILCALIRFMIKSHTINMSSMVKLIEKRDITIDNHIDHLTDAITKQGKSIVLCSRTMEESVDKLVTEQRHSAELLRAMLKNKP